METWAAKKARERKLTVAEMRILRRICGVTKQDRIRNEKDDTQNESSGNLEKKEAKTMCTCDEKREEDYVRKRVLKSVQGNSSRGHDMVDSVRADLWEKGLSGEEVHSREWGGGDECHSTSKTCRS